ncbi:MAG: hypothetical protein P4N59_00500 [Negativicutes bacterium]|nr:hypothetical protein [Negativicutes bacterium]
MKYWDEKMMYGDQKMMYGDDMYHKHAHHCGCETEPEMMEEEFCAPKIKCEPTKECVKTFKCFYKLYRVCHYHLYKVCPHCGHEFDYHHHRGICPKCR